MRLIARRNLLTVTYQTKAQCFTLPFYNLSDTGKIGRHYTWHDSRSKCGSSEISNTVFKILQYYDNIHKIKEVHLCADGCPVQIKNSIMPVIVLYLVNTSSNIKNISIRYFDKTMVTQCISYRTISTVVANAANVFVPTELTTIINLARPSNVKNFSISKYSWIFTF